MESTYLDVYDIGSGAFVKQVTQGGIMSPRMNHCAARGADSVSIYSPEPPDTKRDRLSYRKWQGAAPNIRVWRLYFKYHGREYRRLQFRSIHPDPAELYLDVCRS